MICTNRRVFSIEFYRNSGGESYFGCRKLLLLNAQPHLSFVGIVNIASEDGSGVYAIQADLVIDKIVEITEEKVMFRSFQELHIEDQENAETLEYSDKPDPSPADNGSGGKNCECDPRDLFRYIVILYVCVRIRKRGECQLYFLLSIPLQ